MQVTQKVKIVQNNLDDIKNNVNSIFRRMHNNSLLTYE